MVKILLKFTAILILICVLLFILFSVATYLFGPLIFKVTTIIPYTNPTLTPVPTKTLQVYTPNKNSVVQILYPLSASQWVTTSTTPTIIGRISNYGTPLTKAEFKNEQYPSGFASRGSESYHIQFIPGPLSNVHAEIKDIKKDSNFAHPSITVYGLTEIPYMPCDKVTPNTDGTLSTRPDGTSQNVEQFGTLESCVENLRENLPPVLFFFKPDTPLNPGIYSITIVIDNLYKYYLTVNVDPVYRLTQDLFGSVSPAEKQLSGDMCAGHYDGLEIPLPNIKSSDIGYKILFPQTLEETKLGLTNRMAYIKIQDKQFDLTLPGYKNYYRYNSGEISDRSYSFQSGPSSLHIPTSLLVYKDGTPVIPANLPDHTGMIYPGAYLELLPVDVSGKTYPAETLQHFTTSSSSCDG
ncbi:MAG: hypothetical protein NUV98_00530 [Candidatus Roizmanbacteria bacterium]|nr:hypothetical protein [Candidatus Roizmanbacteria bacterium]